MHSSTGISILVYQVCQTTCPLNKSKYKGDPFLLQVGHVVKASYTRIALIEFDFPFGTLLSTIDAY